MPERYEMFLLGVSMLLAQQVQARTNSNFHISFLSGQVQRSVGFVRMVRVLQVCRVGIQYSFH
jgi:hypothetical protein